MVAGEEGARGGEWEDLECALSPEAGVPIQRCYVLL